MRTFFLVALISIISTLSTFAQQGQNPQPCYQSSEYRQFDFWIGEWDVSDKNGQPQGKSKIELILNGCVLLENWTSAQGVYAGKSLNYFNRLNGKWEQKWIDNSGVPIEFSGTYSAEDKAMYYTAETIGQNGEKVLNKLTFYKKSAAYVNQVWEQSTDDGKTWNTVFDGHYKKRG